MILLIPLLGLMVRTKMYYNLQAITNICSDYIKTAISLLIVTLLNVQKILPTLIPFITLVLTFAAFVFWNGSVVLGWSIHLQFFPSIAEFEF